MRVSFTVFQLSICVPVLIRGGFVIGVHHGCQSAPVTRTGISILHHRRGGNIHRPGGSLYPDGRRETCPDASGLEHVAFARLTWAAIMHARLGETVPEWHALIRSQLFFHVRFRYRGGLTGT